mgnify:CR=1 FL=1
MANVGIPHRRRQLDLYRDDLAVQSLDDKIDLPVPSRCAQVPDPGAVDLSCNPDRQRQKGLEQRARQERAARAQQGVACLPTLYATVFQPSTLLFLGTLVACR